MEHGATQDNDVTMLALPTNPSTLSTLLKIESRSDAARALGGIHRPLRASRDWLLKPRYQYVFGR